MLGLTKRVGHTVGESTSQGGLKQDNVETLVGMFDGQTLSSGGSRVAKYLHENFKERPSECVQWCFTLVSLQFLKLKRESRSEILVQVVEAGECGNTCGNV
jgi:hypothetical protein